MISALHLRTDGSHELFRYDPHSIDGLTELQKRVGGWIEVAPTNDPEITMYCNEEGKIKGFQWNRRASQFLYDQEFDQIAGDVVIVGRPDEDGHDTDLPDDFLLLQGFDDR